MKSVTIVYPGKQSNYSTVACIAGTFEVFAAANSYYRRTGKQELFSVQLAGAEVSEGMGIFNVMPQARISSITKTDLIIIPASVPFYQQAGKKNEELMEWLRQQYRNGADIATMCSGAFMLASTGLLDGRSCSTHWIHANAFRQQFPKVKLMDGQLITDEKGIYTNGGAYSFLNLMIYLVEKYYDRQAAIYCSKIFQIEPDRNKQSSFAIFTGQKQKVKIEAAKKALETSRKTINEVMYEVGYSDVKAFREAFGKITALSPLEYKNRYNKDAED